MIVTSKQKELLVSLLLMLLVTTFFGQLLRIPLWRADVHLYLSDLIVFFLNLSWVFVLIRQRIAIWRHPLCLPLLLFLGVISLSWMVNFWLTPVDQFVVSILYLIRWMMYTNIVFLVSYMSLKDVDIQQKLMRSLLFLILFFSVLGVLQYWFVSDFHWLQYWGWDPHLHRLASTWLDPGYAGLVLVFGLLMIAPHFRERVQYSKYQIVFVWLMVCLGLTFSRASYVALLVGVIVLSILLRSWRIVILYAVSLLLVVLLIPKPGGEGVNLARTSTVNFRVQNWQQALRVIQDYPLTGVGFNRYRYVRSEYVPGETADWQASHSGAGVDNSWLFIMATTGLLGFVAYGFYWLQAVIHLDVLTLPEYRGVGILDMTRGAAQVSMAVLSSWGVHAYFHNSLFYIPAVTVVGVILGVGLVRGRSEEWRL